MARAASLNALALRAPSPSQGAPAGRQGGAALAWTLRSRFPSMRAARRVTVRAAASAGEPEDEWGKEPEPAADQAGAAPAAAAVAEAAALEAPAKSEVAQLKVKLKEALYGTERGLRASSETRAGVVELITQLEARNPTPAPTEALALLNGKWILADRDTVFTSNFWTELFTLAGVKLRMSSAFHPQTDGQSEVLNCIITMYLRCLAGDRPRSWLQWLSWAEFCYNTSFQTAIRCSPFEVVYGRPPPAVVPLQPGTARVAAVNRQLAERDVFLADVRDRLLQAQRYLKEHQDHQHRELSYQVGDWVWLRLHHRTTAGVTLARPSKLGPKYYGPFQVLARIGEVAYKLQLPEKARIHDVFHVALLKRFEGTPPGLIVPLPPLLHGRVLPSPATVIRARLNRGTWELLIQWTGRAAADASWEKLEEFKKNLPEFQLVDELFLGKGGNVVDSFTGRTYQRRKKAQASGSGYTSFSQLLPLLGSGRLPEIVKVEEISQIIDSENFTVQNCIKFSGPLATTSVSTNAKFEVRSPKRVQIKFDEGVIGTPQLTDSIVLPEKFELFGQNIDLAPLKGIFSSIENAASSVAKTISGQPPLKIPIRTNNAESWLLTTYLDEELRISRGDGSSIFVLFKEGSTLLN